MTRDSILWVVVIAIGAAAYYGWNHTHWLDSIKPTDKQAEKRAAAQKRFEEWAYFDKTKKLSESEELSLLVVPSKFNEALDVTCLVYRNREFRQVILTCPNAVSADLDVESALSR